MTKRQSQIRAPTSGVLPVQASDYGRLVSDISGLLEQARRTTVRTTNSIITTTYWRVGRRIVEFEQGGKERAEYGEELLVKLGNDLTKKHGRGFSMQGLYKMRGFYLGWQIFPTPSGQLEALAKCPALTGDSSGAILPTSSGVSMIAQTPSAQSLSGSFPLSWSHYVRSISVENPLARAFYESEAIRSGWSVRQLDRQIGTQFFERTASSKRQEIMLARGQQAKPEDAVSLQEEIRDPYFLEFLNLKDEYSETDLEDAIIRHLEWFILELGAGFTFVARQKRIRVGDEWYRMDLLLFHRKLKCLVVIDLKLVKFTHADAGQMNLYLNYAHEHMMEPGEGEPVGLILCSAKDNAVVHYAMGGINANVFASRYMTVLPNEETLRKEILATQRALEGRVLLQGAQRTQRRRAGMMRSQDADNPTPSVSSVTSVANPPSVAQDPLTERIIGAAIEVHRTLGPGLLESIYEEALCIEFQLRGIPFQRQVEVDVHYKGHVIKGQRLDLLVAGEVVVELKAVASLPDLAMAQVLSYLKATGLRRALLINFGVAKLVTGIKRISL